MTDFTGVAAVGTSLVRFLSHCFAEQQPVNTAATTVVLARTEDLDKEEDPLISAPCLSLFLYRLDYNKTMRAAWSSVGHAHGRSFLPLDFHFLMIPWGENAEQEYHILGRTLQCFEDTPILSGPLLDPVTNWSANETIQVCLEDLSTEDVMRTFDSLPIDYKLCVPYVARIMVVEGQRLEGELDAAQADFRFRAEVEK